MGRMCKCQIDGKILNTDTAYRINKNGKNLYYCNEEEYKKSVEIKNKLEQEKQEVYEIIGELLGGIKNKYLYVKISELQKQYSYKLILNYLYEHKDYISRAMNKNFVNASAKIGYLLAIISNNIVGYEIPIENIIHIEHEITESKYKSKNKRRSLSDIEKEVLGEIE